MNRPSDRRAWQTLADLARQGQPHLRDLQSDPWRERHLRWHAAGIELDSTRQRITPEVHTQLLALSEASEVMPQAQAMWRGERINVTENRAVLHVALRGAALSQPPWGADLADDVAHELRRMLDLAQAIREGQLTGHDGQTFTDVVNLGIGGSDLGPRMATQALEPYQPAGPAVRVHFVSNVDAWCLHQTLRQLEPARTLFVVQSKTFTTQETMTLADSARRWLRDAGCPADRLDRHLVAVTAQAQQARAQGIAEDRILLFWDWVGGRYSVWSAIGLPLAVAIGAAGFQQFLAGAHEMDQHFMTAPAEQNLPLMLALLGIWNRNFLGAATHHIAPYAAALQGLPAFLQQMDMESNGKRTHRNGQPVAIDTAPIIWGGLGIDGQHAYFQLIHQGTHLVPVDFIGVKTETTPLPLAARHHEVVLLNLRAQAQALALGRTPEQTRQALLAAGMDEATALAQSQHRAYTGNVPSNLLWLESLTPRSLGALLALYEHKVFCQAAIWDINAYDQWGVELGKLMAKQLESGQVIKP